MCSRASLRLRADESGRSAKILLVVSGFIYIKMNLLQVIMIKTNFFIENQLTLIHVLCKVHKIQIYMFCSLFFK
jgi:hypothetical protein